MTAPLPTQLPPDGDGGGFYWDGRAWSPRPRKVFRPNLGIVIMVGVVLLIFVGYNVYMSHRVASGGFRSESSPPSIPSTFATTPPGEANNFLACKQTDVTGASFYVQEEFSGAIADICSAGQQRYTQEEFQAIPGLKLQCTYNPGGPVARSHSTVSVYNDGSEDSTAAAHEVCMMNGG